MTFDTSEPPGIDTVVAVYEKNQNGAVAKLDPMTNAEFSPGLTNIADLRITATVPPDATDGPITIRTPHGDVTSTAEFVVMPPPLTVAATPNGRVEVSCPVTSAQFVLETADNLLNPQWATIDAGLERGNGRTVFRPSTAPGHPVLSLAEGPRRLLNGFKHFQNSRNSGLRFGQ